MKDLQHRKKVTLSLSGCGFLSFYHIGVVSCFRDFEEYIEIERFAGTSAGALVAACYLCLPCLGQITQKFVKTLLAAKASPVGPLSPRFNIDKFLRDQLSNLPENAHEICSGRLSISLTKFPQGANWMVDQFASKEDLIQALLCTSFVPFYSGYIPPYFRNARYYDGGFTNNLPTFDQDTITVSPLSGETDICPADTSNSFAEVNISHHSVRINCANARRVSHALFPPHAKELSELCEQGYADALRYIRTSLINQDRAVPVPVNAAGPIFGENVMQVQEDGSQDDAHKSAGSLELLQNSDQELTIDKALRTMNTNAFSEAGNLPDPVMEVLREACESVQHPALRALAIVTIPWVLPLEFMYSTCIRIVELVPRPGTAELLYYIEFVLFTVRHLKDKGVLTSVRMNMPISDNTNREICYEDELSYGNRRCARKSSFPLGNRK